MSPITESRKTATPDRMSPTGLVCLRSDTVGMAHVVVAGELDIASCPQLDREVRGAPDDIGTIVLDLREVTFMDSAGMHLMLEADDRIRSAGRRLLVVRGPAAVGRLFEVMGVETRLECVDRPPGEPDHVLS